MFLIRLERSGHENCRTLGADIVTPIDLLAEN